MKKNSTSYRWVIMISSFFIMAVPFSIINTIHTLFLGPVSEKLGFSISQFSIIFTITAITVAITSPFIGKLINHLSIKIVMTTGALFCGGGFIIYSFITKIYLFYLVAIMVGVGLAAIAMIPVSTMITNWFQDDRGFAMGISFAGIGTGTFFWMQIVSRVLSHYGHHFTYLLLGILILIISLPITLFLVKKSPQENSEVKSTVDKTQTAKEKLNFKKITKNNSFWTFSVALFLLGIAISGTQVHVQSYLRSLGFSLTFSANIGSTLAISALVGSIVGGIIFDKLSATGALCFVGSMNIISLVLLIFSNISYISYLFAILFGFSLCLPSLWPPYGVGQIFGKENYSTTLGFLTIFFTIGAAIGPSLSGLIADSIFGYQAAWVFYLILTIGYLWLFIKSSKQNQ